MRIAIVAHRELSNGNYRALPLTQLAQRGHSVVPELDGVRLAALSRYDVVHVYRYHDLGMRRVVRALREQGVAIVWDNDDDLTRGVDTAPGALRSQSARVDMREMVRLAHVVTTPSPVLAARYREWGAGEVIVIDNYLPDWFAHRPRPARGAELVIGWLASKEHEDDLVALNVTGALQSVLDEHPDVRIESIGIHLGLPPDRYRQTMHVRFDQLPARLAAFDIGIAPLADTPFNRARSSVKLKEYASVGVPWLASPVGAYRDLGSKQGGQLVANGNWAAEIGQLIKNEKQRRKLSERGLKWVVGERAAARPNAERWERAMRRALQLSSGAR